MATRLNLTNKSVSKLSGDTGRRMVHDRDVRGFCVDVRETGAKTFYFYGRINGRVRKVRIGEFPGMDCESARKKARSIIGSIADGRALKDRAQAGRATLSDLFAHYLDVHAKPKKKTWQRDVAEFDRLVRPELGKRPIVEINRGDVARLLTAIQENNGKGPARKIRALLHKMYRVAIEEDWTDRNPVTGTHRPDFDPRQRYLKPDEVRKFFAAVQQLRDEVSRDFIMLALFTGQRRANVCAMEWAEVDFDRKLWTIPKGKFKGKRQHVVPLPEEALAILQRRYKHRPRGNPFVLPSWGPKGHYNNPKTAWERVLELSGLADLRLHDLRRTVGAWLNEQGTSTRIIQGALGHSDIRTTAQAYTPTELHVIREAVGTVAASITKAAKGKVTR